MIITVQIKSNYGKEAIYPVCQKALSFAAIAGKQTLSRNDIAHIKDIGFTVNVENQTL